MKILKATLLATIFAAGSSLAYAQVSVDAGGGVSAGGSVTSGSNDSNTSVGAGVDASVGANADAGSVDTGSYTNLTASISSSATADFSSVSDSTEIHIVLISSLESEAEADAWAKLMSENSANIETLHSKIEQNSSLNARLTAELAAEGDFTLDDVVAISTSAEGSMTVYVDDED